MSLCASSLSYSSKKKLGQNLNKTICTSVDQNFEDFSLVLLDEKRAQYETQSQLRCVINYMKSFQNIEQCVKYVRSIRNEKVFLIVSDRLSKTVIPRVHDHSQLEHIYIYCHRHSNTDLSDEDYAKVSGVFSDNGSLITQLKDDYRISSQNLCPTSIVSLDRSMDDFDSISSTLNWFPLLINTIIRTPQSDSMRKCLIGDCELGYIDNELAQKSIDDFRRNYKQSEVLSWYKRDCFIYRLLNKAFRSEDIVTIFKYRFLLADMNQRLKTLQTHYIAQLPSEQKQLTLYRGQGISSEELEKIQASVGKLISLNTCFRTTDNIDTAIACAKNGENPFVESIVFEIVINRSIIEFAKPFAPISGEDNDHNEILFSPCTIFQSESIRQCDSLWYIRLRLISEKHTHEMQQINDILKRDDTLSSSLTSVGYCLWKIGKQDKAERIFNLLLREIRTFDDDQISSIYNDIGLLYNDRSCHSDALDYFEKALKHAKKSSVKNNAHIGSILNSIGFILAKKKKYQDALKYYKESLQLRLEITDSNPTHLANIATTYANIGCLYADMRLFSQSLINLDKALDIRLKQLPEGHPDLGQSYNALGYVYFLQGYLKRALKTYHMALDINLASLNANHPDTLKTYSNIGAVHFAEREYQLAIEYYENALEIGRKVLSRDHPTFVELYQSIAFVYKAMKNKSLTLKYFRKALNIEKNRSKPNHTLLFEINTHIGTCFEALGKNSTALNHYKTARTHGFKMRTQNYSRLTTLQGSIQRCVNREEDSISKTKKKR